MALEDFELANTCHAKGLVDDLDDITKGALTKQEAHAQINRVFTSLDVDTMALIKQEHSLVLNSSSYKCVLIIQAEKAVHTMFRPKSPHHWNATVSCTSG